MQLLSGVTLPPLDDFERGSGRSEWTELTGSQTGLFTGAQPLRSSTSSALRANWASGWTVRAGPMETPYRRQQRKGARPESSVLREERGVTSLARRFVHDEDSSGAACSSTP